MEPTNVDKPVDLAGIGSAIRVHLPFQSVLLFVIMAAAIWCAVFISLVCFRESKRAEDRHEETIQWLSNIEGQLGIIKVHVKSKQPLPVILLSYDSAGKLRTVRLDDKGRVIASPGIKIEAETRD